MPHQNQMVMGKRRGEWVRDAAKALIATTDPQTRFLMLRAGFVTFEQRCKPQFRNLAGFDFTSTELRWVWDYLSRWVWRKEARLQAGFEKIYGKTKRKNSTDRFNVDTSEPDYFVETATRGRVH